MLYIVAKFICRLVLLLIRRWKIIGDSYLPPGQGMLLISNHVSYWDPVVIGCAINRRIYFMAKEELFHIPVLAWIIKNFGAFPVQRNGGGRDSIKKALDLLKGGKVVGIFPEGTRSKTGDLLNPHQGAAMLALKGGVPLLPVAVSGTKGFWGQVKVVFGKPLYFDTPNRSKVSRTEMESVSRQAMEEIGRLLTLAEK
ncbi:MAG: 1-acyl-sn-glycerol-3-phosphate acyltransferase [Firmicutes bacterium]|nr:1-acyl-sn-glycerol-3-phosphate acyltransferase [Bacillota bacterium]